jgi:hypothetical protein
MPVSRPRLSPESGSRPEQAGPPSGGPAFCFVQKAAGRCRHAASDSGETPEPMDRSAKCSVITPLTACASSQDTSSAQTELRADRALGRSKMSFSTGQAPTNDLWATRVVGDRQTHDPHGDGGRVHRSLQMRGLGHVGSTGNGTELVASAIRAPAPAWRNSARTIVDLAADCRGTASTMKRLEVWIDRRPPKT